MSITIDSITTPVARTTTARPLLIALATIAATAGFLATDASQTAHMIKLDGESLTRLMRAMAIIKFLFAAIAFTAIIWRLAAPITTSWLLAYATATAGMAAGPGLIWGMVHILAGAVALHGGLLLAVILLWRDPAIGTQLATLINRRRATLAH